ncbi:MAG: DUF177 domain-containing protein [Clostridiales bacterium]|nr:DUF177 domain-containing protein [Clostridiales bacterium]
MFVNLTDVFNSEDEELSLQVETDMTEVSIGGEIFQITGKLPIQLDITNIGKDKAMIKGRAEFIFSLSCDRCLEPVEEKMTLNICREVYSPDAQDVSLDSDEQSFMDGYQLNVEDLLNNEIMINWPMKILCRPDCKGICLQCGKNLNTGDCGCDTFVPDPRMAAIKDIFDANKEV